MTLSLNDIGVETLKLLGEFNPSFDINDINTKASRSISTSYASVRRSLLNEHTWNFSKKRASLSETTPPDFGYSRAFQLPADYLKFVGGLSCFSFENNLLLTNDETVNLIYVADIEETGRFSQGFCDVLIYDLAIRNCTVITGSNTLLAGLVNLRKEMFKEAKRINALEGEVKRINFNTDRHDLI